MRPLDRAQIFTVVSETLFLVVHMEALLLEKQVLWRQTRLTAEKGSNF